MYTISRRETNEAGEVTTTPIMEREFLGALKKPILSAIRARLNEEGEVLISVSNKQDFMDLIITATPNG